MKKKILVTVCIVIATLIACTVTLTGCDWVKEMLNTAPKEYTIQYTDDLGTHQLTVTAGMPYAIDVVPEKTGYTFAGLFDAEEGGTQYVSSNGASLSPFTDGKNMVLFPQFKAKNYNVILDYQGANVTGSRQLNVAYGSSLPELPKNLAVEHKEFVGWYTKANCEGVRVADEYGLIPVVSILNDTNFDLSGEYIYLYAGFEIEKFTVTCCFEEGMDTEDLNVEYDTPVNQIVTKTRVNGKAPLTWSKTQSGEVWNGKITADTVLYAIEYAPVIDFDSNGGNKINSIVARSGSAISLPLPTKELAKFVYWEDLLGNRFTSATMPSKSISLKAVWQAKLVFDENGGSDVDDISVAEGNSINLPSSEREGFIFAGWYTADKEQYTSTTMPVEGMKLKAGWYKVKHETINYVSDSSYIYVGGTSSQKSPVLSDKMTIDLSSILSEDFAGLVNIDAHFKYSNNKGTLQNKTTLTLYIYNTATVSDIYLIDKFTFYGTSTYTDYSFNLRYNLIGNKLYVAYTDKIYNWSSTYVKDYYVAVDYPDTTYLYL